MSELTIELKAATFGQFRFPLPRTVKQLISEIEALEARIEARDQTVLEAITKEGWRSCIDHIIRPDSPCPVCRIEELTATFTRMENAWREEVEKEKVRWLK